MKNYNNNGYATLITIITIGIISIIIFGILNLHYLTHVMIRSNESSIKAYYLGESGITLLKKKVDTAFENIEEAYVLMLESQEEAKVAEGGGEKYHQGNTPCFRSFALKQREIQKLEKVEIEENVFSFYTEPHGWRLETVFEEEEIFLYATGHYRKARKRIVSIISYPEIRIIGNEETESSYQFFPSEILFYYQGYEGDGIQ